MMIFTIASRTAYAEVVLDLAYAGRSGDCLSNQVTDIVTDIMHLCDQESISFEEILSLADMHHKAELLEEHDNCEVIGSLH